MSRYRFGKRPPVKDYRTLFFKNYLKAELAPPPTSYNVLDTVYDKLGINDPTILFPMDGNDQYGDCTIAAAAHAATVYAALIGKNYIMGQQDVQKVYFQLTEGGDTGLDELKVVNYWQSTGIGSEKIIAFASIDPKNHTHVQQAMYMFGGVYLGFQVQQGAQEQFDNRQPWVPAPLINDGHAVYAVAYDQTGLTVLTWGNTQRATWDWWDECVDEAYAILPTEATILSFNPNFDFDQLQADLQNVAG